MKLKTINIKNFRLLQNVSLEVDPKMTLVVGRNNSGKTSFIDLLSKVVNNKSLKFADFPISNRKKLYENIYDFLTGKITFDVLIEKIDKTEISFIIDYSDEEDSKNLGFLSNFIIDIDDDIEETIISAEYCFNVKEEKFRDYFSGIELENKNKSLLQIKEILTNVYENLFDLVIYAVNPGDIEDRLIKSVAEFNKLFKVHKIAAERELGETDEIRESQLGLLLGKILKDDIENTFPELKENIIKMQEDIVSKNKQAQEDINKSLTEIIKKAVKMGYPNEEKVEIKVQTNFKLESQIKNNTELLYSDNELDENLPSAYNGLGYKNLLKIEFELASFAQEINLLSDSIIPLLLIEEPESHMHPQLQQKFIKYITEYINDIFNNNIQTVITTHSSHISSEADFSNIRYVKRFNNWVTYENLSDFVRKDNNNLDFIKKYLTITRCDLFFADKIILVEGAAERLLIPDMINKCDNKGYFKKDNLSLKYQYYTILEVGGAYAHKFFPFIDFLNIPTLIITDFDSTKSNANKKQEKCLVSEAETTSNCTIKEWFKIIEEWDGSGKLDVKSIISLEKKKKTLKNKHIEYQTYEEKLCGRSLEEAIKNSNRELYNLGKTPKESDLDFNSSDNKKTEFALDLLMKDDYNIPQYIRNGLEWLSSKNPYVDGEEIDE